MTKDGDMLDAVCWKLYGNESTVAAVLEANSGLADYGPIFPAGVVIMLPDLVTGQEKQAIRLWD
jgi:phage tail protein X